MKRIKYVIISFMMVISLFHSAVNVDAKSCNIINNYRVEIQQEYVYLRPWDNLQLNISTESMNVDDNNITWESSDESVAVVDQDGLITAIGEGTCTIAAYVDSNDYRDSVFVRVEDPEVEVKYASYYCKNYHSSWECDGYNFENCYDCCRRNGEISGSVGAGESIQAIRIGVEYGYSTVDVDLGVRYTTHCQSYGWLPWSADGDENGITDEGKRMEAIMIELTGDDAAYFDIYYRTHVQSYGWLDWAKNGEPAGTAGYGKRLEAIQIIILKKGESVPDSLEGVVSTSTQAYIAKPGVSPVVNGSATDALNPVVPVETSSSILYQTHVQTYGWQNWKFNGSVSGTTGESKRLEGIKIKTTLDEECNGDIIYTTHVQTYGWQDDLNDKSTWSKNGYFSGTWGESKRLEAICIDLTGRLADKYDVYYRVHAQTYGWLGWAKNGEPSGTAGYAKRLEGIQIVLVEKGGPVPANNYGGVTSNRAESYISK